MSRSQNLYRLQQIDSKVDQADTRLREIESLLSNNAQLRKASALADNADVKLAAAQRDYNQAETKVKDQRIKIEQVESNLYSGTVRNPKELQDMQNEVAALKRFLDILEERQIETMLALDDAADIHQDAQQTLQKVQVLVDNQRAKLNSERQQIQTARAASLEQRPGVEGIIDPDDQDTYNRLHKKRAGVAVARVNDRACSACGSTLTAALFQAARSPSQVVFCESCGRILHGT